MRSTDRSSNTASLTTANPQGELTSPRQTGLLQFSFSRRFFSV